MSRSLPRRTSAVAASGVSRTMVSASVVIGGKLRVSPGTVRRAKMARVKSENTTEGLPAAAWVVVARPAEV